MEDKEKVISDLLKDTKLLDEFFEKMIESVYERISKNPEMKEESFDYINAKEKLDNYLFNSSKEEKELFDKYFTASSIHETKFSDMMYKYGFSDGIKLVLECLSKYH